MSDNEDTPAVEEKKQEENKENEENNDDNVDANVFDQSNDLIEDQIEADFQCINPQTKAGHIVYVCRGTDEIGFWEGERRYNEFFTLHSLITARWPGVPIPMLPPKKRIGNKDIRFINERRFYLERFLKKISKFPFILNSAEFKIFTRPTGDIEKMFKASPKVMTWEIVEKMKTCLEINEELFDPIQKNDFEMACKDFQDYAKNMTVILKTLVKDI
jgi:hypothetical protein